jgi:uncharacterized protein YdhG (YjbR/CyaY superfamily)
VTRQVQLDGRRPLDCASSRTETLPVSRAEVDAYLADLDEPQRSTLGELRRTILDVLPEAEECISYAMPAFRVQGQVVAGFAAFKHHLSYLPHSGSVIPKLHDDVARYTTSKGALQFPVDEPLPRALVEKLVAVRLSQLAPDGSRTEPGPSEDSTGGPPTTP